MVDNEETMEWIDSYSTCIVDRRYGSPDGQAILRLITSGGKHINMTVSGSAAYMLLLVAKYAGCKTGIDFLELLTTEPILVPINTKEKQIPSGGTRKVSVIDFSRQFRFEK